MNESHLRRDDGSIHVLMLAVVIAFVVVAAIVRDIGTVAMTKWQAMQAAEAAADAAAQAVDQAHYTATGQLRLDPARARRLAAASLQNNERLAGLTVEGATVRVEVTRDAHTVLVRVGARTESSTSTLEIGVDRPEP